MTILLADAGGFGDGGAYQCAITSTGAFSIIARPAWWWQADERAILQLGNGIIGSNVKTAYVATSGWWITQSFNVAFEDITSDPFFGFAGGSCSDGNCWTLALDNGVVKLYDSTASYRGTVASGIAVNTSYRVTVKYNVANPGSLVIWWSLAGDYHSMTPQWFGEGWDFIGGTSTSPALSFMNEIGMLYAKAVYFGAWTVRLDDGATILANDTRQSPMYERQYQNDITTAVPDTGDGGGNSLTTGTWDDADQIPTDESAGNICTYTGTDVAFDGVCTSDDDPDGGPVGDENAVGRTWLRAYWAWRWKAKLTAGIKIYANWYGNYGAHATPATDGTINTTPTQGNSVWQTKLVQEWADGAEFPASDEYMQQGFGTLGSGYDGDVSVADQWCGLVIQYPTAGWACLDGVVSMVV